ncbi:MAG: tripartite tricarboxylate transporter permease [Spirochaetales bacterium]|jgi:putative tricarboxylic transport membrane protein|nr:tripartite tricarboxylate transporter permease [Spirochaetales bacterium]NLX44967.1 C4-dicarboxylate ABC transporter permease [Treponema sp.]
MEAILQAFGAALQLKVILMMILGAVVGIVFGAIPGLTYSMGIILVLPLTFNLDPLAAITLLLGVYVGGMTGGSVSAIILGIPGTPSAAATCLDGHRLAKEGKAGKALGTAVFSATIGGLISVLILVVVAPIIAKFALKFGPAEIFALVFFGFSAIAGISSGKVIKGLISGMIGLLVMTMGMDPVMGVKRYTFGSINLLGGVDVLSFMIGMFAIPQIVEAFATDESAIKRKLDTNVSMSFPTFKEIKGLASTILKSALIGVGIGAIPGTGGPIAAFLGYDQAKRKACSDEPTLDCVAGPEAAHNGVTGGALIPMLTLGIPGDPATAILLGALLIHGLKPGPLLFQENSGFVYGIYATLFIINILVFSIQSFGIRFFVKVLDFKKSYLYTTIMVLCVIGSYSSHNNMFDVFTMFAAGLIGFFMQKFGFPVAPTILALVLGPTMEDSFRRALILSQGNFATFVASPISIVFYVFTAFVLVSQVRRKKKTKKA